MDEINKDIQKELLGTKMDENNTRIACLLWVDDVLLISTPQEELQNAGHNKPHNQEIPQRIRKIQKQHNEKRTKHKENSQTWRYGTWCNPQIQVPTCRTNKEQQRHPKRPHHNDERENRSSKPKILTTAGNATSHYLEMEVIWKTTETNISPILTDSGEVWKPTKKEEEINRICDNMIKRILKTPQSTPRGCLYIKTSLTQLQPQKDTNRFTMHNRISNGSNQNLKALLQRTGPSSWAEENKTQAAKIGLDKTKQPTNKPAR